MHRIPPPVSTENLYQGEIGERLGDAFLFNFFAIGERRPDISIDRTGHLREAGDSPVCFNFQIKTARKFLVETKTLYQWSDMVEAEPVVLLHVQRVDLLKQHYRFLLLHDWMLEHPEWRAQLGKKRRVQFSLSEFTLSDELGSNFRQSVAEEADRVSKKASARWRTRRSPLLPIREMDIFSHFGRLGSFDVPKTLLEEVSEWPGLSLGDDVWHRLRDLWSLPERYREQAATIPAVQDWLSEILTSPSPFATERELTEFRRFVDAMRRYDADEAFPIPGFKWRRISAWRVFVQMFPEAFRLFERFFDDSRHWPPDQHKAALLLTSTLAHSDDGTLANRAHDLLRKAFPDFISPHVADYSRYGLLREFLFVRAEAEGGSHVRRCQDFLHRCKRITDEDWELRLHREYYDATDSVTKEALSAKLRNPKPRDVYTAGITEMILERVDQGLRSRSNSARRNPSAQRT